MGRAFADVWEHLIAVIPAGWTERAPGLIGGVTGSALPTLNGVWVYGEDDGAAAASELLERVAAAGLPHCAQLCPAATADLRRALGGPAMQREEDVPLMALDDPGLLPEVELPELVINVLEPDTVGVHAELAAVGFGAPVEDLRRLIGPEVAAAPGVQIYVGEVDGSPVVTGIGVRLGDRIGVFNIATLPTHRRRGYGAAITARVVRDGLRRGAEWAWLQSSPEGYGVYERLGFRTLESWECWIAS